MDKIVSRITSGSVSSNDPNAFSLKESRDFGERVSGRIAYLPHEALFLLESGRLSLFDARDRELDFDTAVKVFSRGNKDFFVEYVVFKDLRKKGYILKTALKFGATFRAYEKGSRHSRWVVFACSSSSRLKWSDFSAKGRVANNVGKSTLIAIVDEEFDISYYDVKWSRP